MSCKSSQSVKLVLASLLSLSFVPQTLAQITDSRQTMRPVIRGRHAAVASMKAEATEVARQILDAGGNAFDAAVGGQAALAVTDFAYNGVGSDAVLLVYNARKTRSIPSMPSLARPSSRPSSGTRKITAAKFPRVTAFSPAACPALLTPGTRCSTAGAR